MKRDDEALVTKLSAAARRLAVDADDGPPPAAWLRLQGERTRRAAARGRTRLLVLGVAAACAVVAARAALWRPRPLTYTVAGGRLEANGYIRGADTENTELGFSDGTRVRLARGTRMSVGVPGSLGARLRVEDGEAHFEVAHRPGADWSVEVGPYRVQVTGTVFDVRWSGASQDASVTLRAGAVRIAGPHLAAPVTLAAGQRLIARLALAEVRIEPENTPVVAAPRPANAPTADVAPAPRPPAETEHPKLHAAASVPHEAPRAVEARAPAAPASFRQRDWAERVARGDGAAVLAEARARSLDEVVATVDSPALAALADAARYAGEPTLSQRVLAELRRRFPASPQAPAAAFLLGRLADDRNEAAAALSWYRRYREEAPRGPYAAEALGREMLAVERLSGREAASVLARDYLGRFPDGTYFLQARAILGLP